MTEQELRVQRADYLQKTIENALFNHAEFDRWENRNLVNEALKYLYDMAVEPREGGDGR